ncbi:MAG TPA: hypothetical protein VLV48_09820 [Thermoanaerobaculia bacterium]|nr:hypothetical protein [Thermoanaerobaculia bacterium]
MAIPRDVQPPPYPPIHFYAQADVPSGGESTVRSEAISNRTGRPVEIHEIRIAANVTEVPLENFNPAAFTRVRMTVGGKPITNAFVPMWLFGRIENPTSQFVAAAHPAATISSAMYVWRLSRPWYLPPNVPVEVQFQHAGAVTRPVVARIGLAGRYVDRRSPTSAIPYAASFVSRPFTYSEVGYDESSERDIFNITDREVHVDRIMARVGVARSTADHPLGETTETDDFSQVNGITVRLLTSTNLPIIRDYSSVFGIFGREGAIDVAHTLAENDFYRVGVRKIAGPVLVSAFGTWTGQANVGILGWREEGI